MGLAEKFPEFIDMGKTVAQRQSGDFGSIELLSAKYHGSSHNVQAD